VNAVLLVIAVGAVWFLIGLALGLIVGKVLARAGQFAEGQESDESQPPRRHGGFSVFHRPPRAIPRWHPVEAPRRKVQRRADI
jgi:hypothetical protein